MSQVMEGMPLIVAAAIPKGAVGFEIRLEKESAEGRLLSQRYCAD